MKKSHHDDIPCHTRLCIKWCDMVQGCMVHTECTVMTAVSSGASHVRTKQRYNYTACVDIQSVLHKATFTCLESHATRAQRVCSKGENSSIYKWSTTINKPGCQCGCFVDDARTGAETGGCRWIEPPANRPRRPSLLWVAAQSWSSSCRRRGRKK